MPGFGWFGQGLRDHGQPSAEGEGDWIACNAEAQPDASQPPHLRPPVVARSPDRATAPDRRSPFSAQRRPAVGRSGTVRRPCHNKREVGLHAALRRNPLQANPLTPNPYRKRGEVGLHCVAAVQPDAIKCNQTPSPPTPLPLSTGGEGEQECRGQAPGPSARALDARWLGGSSARITSEPRR